MALNISDKIIWKIGFKRKVQVWKGSKIWKLSTICRSWLPDCPASSQSGTGLEKANDVGKSPVPDLSQSVRHFLVRYRTEMTDAGMPMLALVSWMPMPTYADKK
jgi:hypothetical protein